MKDVSFENAISYLLQQIPEIRDFYERRCVELYAQGLADVVFGSILVEYLTITADEGADSEADSAANTITRIFEMIEDLATSSDFNTRCLVEVSVLESILGEEGGLKRFGSYMGRQTRAMASALAKRWELNEELDEIQPDGQKP